MSGAHDGCTFLAKVKPGSRENRIVGTHANMLVIHVTAAPERGRANKAVIQTIAGAFGVGKSAVSILTGQTAGIKRISVDGFSRSQYHTFFNGLQKTNHKD